MKKSVQAFGKNYFQFPRCPIAVQTVDGRPYSQHAFDLTGTMHYHDFTELVVVAAGRGVQVINEIEYPVAAGDVFVLQGFSEHAFRERGTLALLNVQFDASLLPLPAAFLRRLPGYNVLFQLEPRLRSRRIFRYRLHLEPQLLAAVAARIEALKLELEAQRDGFEAAAFSGLLELIILFSRQYSSLQTGNANALLRLGKVISRLEEDFTAEWTLERIARLAATSPNNLLRLFKAATGCSPIGYLIRLRLQHDARLLESEWLCISDVELRCGFNDANYFSKKFKAFYRVSPRAYRATPAEIKKR